LSVAVTQLQPSTAQLSLENSVLLAQEFDHVPLLLFEPSEERRDKEMQRNHGASLCQCLVDPVLRHNGVSYPCLSQPHNIATKNWNGNTPKVYGKGARFSFGQSVTEFYDRYSLRQEMHAALAKWRR
jgi:hypothetical protein